MRFMRKNKIHALINVMGLTFGMASSVLIFLYVQDELSYDSFHTNGDRIYRISGLYEQGGTQKNASAQTTYLMKRWLDDAFPDIERVVRFGPSSGLIRYEDKAFQEGRLLFADEAFFEMFSFPLLKGDPANVIAEPNSVVISEAVVRKYFGDEDPMGNSLDFDGNVLVKVTGVMREMPHNSHFHADLVFSMKTAEPFYPAWILTNATGTSHYTYVQLATGITPETIEKQVADYMPSKGKEFAEAREYFLQPLRDIHLHSKLTGEMGANGDIVYVSVLSAVAVIILIIASFNYMNLAIARSASRAREVGIRKVAGARRKQLILQFLGEATLTSIIAMSVALFLARLGLPLLNQLSGKALQTTLLADFTLIALLFFLALLVGGVAGSYPAAVLSAFKTVSMLKGKGTRVSTRSINLRKGLLIVQFVMSILLLLSTLVILEQLTFMHNKKLGVNPEQVVIVPFQNSEMAVRFEQFRTDLLNHPGVIEVAATNNNLTARVGHWRGYSFPGKAEKIYIPTMVVTQEFFRTLQAEIVHGRDFDRQFTADVMHSYIINEAAARMLGLDEPVGTAVSGDMFTGSEWSQKEATT
jgi:putative ABC transport system permease protein